MDLELEGKTALISGSSRGIGLAIAMSLHNEGCNVMINGRDSKKLKISCEKIGSNAKYFAADVTKKSESVGCAKPGLFWTKIKLRAIIVLSAKKNIIKHKKKNQLNEKYLLRIIMLFY